MAKERLSFTLDKDTLNSIENLLKNGNYRNHSHVVERAIKFLREDISKKGDKIERES